MAYTDELRTPRTMTDAEIDRILAVTGEHKDGFRDHCIYSIALGTALREHEILALNVGDVFATGGTPKRRVQLRVFKRSNHDSASHEVMLNEQVRTKLGRLWKVKAAAGHDMTADAPIFVSREGHRLSAGVVRWGFAQWQERAGFERRFTFHQLRHTSVTNAYRVSGRDIRVAQRFARHASIRSTQIYTHPSDSEVLAAVNLLRC